MNLGKTTIYYYTRKIHGKRQMPFEPPKDDENIGEFIGIFAGDGCYVEYDYYHITKFYFSGDEKEYAESVKNLVSQMFNRTSCLSFDKTSKIWMLRFHSKDVGNFIKIYLVWKGRKTYSMKMKRLNHSRDYKIGFLRGYLDTDGFCDRNSRKVSMFGVSERMMKQINLTVKSLGFKTKYYKDANRGGNRKPLYFVNLSGQEAMRFIRKIKPRNSKRIRKWAHQDLKSHIKSHETFDILGPKVPNLES